MSWIGAFLGLGIALALVGVLLAMGTMASQKSMYKDAVVGNYGVAAVLLIIGAVIVGAVVGV